MNFGSEIPFEGTYFSGKFVKSDSSGKYFANYLHKKSHSRPMSIEQLESMEIELNDIVKELRNLNDIRQQGSN